MRARERLEPVAPPFVGEAIRYVLTLGAWLLASSVAVTLPVIDRSCIQPWTEANASAAAGVASLVGYPSYATHASIITEGASLKIKSGCNGVEAFLILASAVLAFPASWPRRIAGVLLGGVTVFGLNIVRLVNLLLIAVHFPSRLDFFHVYVWQTLIVVLAFGVFLVWRARLAGNA